MEKKQRYFSPETEVMELKLEGVIATSAPEYEDGIRLFGPDLNNPTRR
jgi:hypothetical protein